MASSLDPKVQSFIPLASPARDGYSNDSEATATCFCGSVQYAFPTKNPAIPYDAFICHCSDCHKFTASMFASNFILKDSDVRFVRGEDLLTEYAQAITIASGNTMANHFCSKCGTLMYRITSGAPDRRIARIGTVDDFSLHHTLLVPTKEQYTKHRNSWVAKMADQENRTEFHDGFWPKVRGRLA